MTSPDCKQKNRSALWAIFGGVVAAVLTNADRLPFGSELEDRSQPMTVSAESWWENDPRVAELAPIRKYIAAFTEDLQSVLPPRNEALQDHRSLDQLCGTFKPAADYAVSSTYFANAHAELSICLNKLEDIAGRHNVPYDLGCARRATLTLQRFDPQKP
ncbi:MAG: hypothetical protein H6867_10750 [Rhodospirillales bacterium]|nr:hypothetical protein [Rhodospirillales bacterium]MCB9995740.1 hypothetical protein [Rhodospirillales bacterium]